VSELPDFQVRRQASKTIIWVHTLWNSNSERRVGGAETPKTSRPRPCYELSKALSKGVRRSVPGKRKRGEKKSGKGHLQQNES